MVVAGSIPARVLVVKQRGKDTKLNFPQCPLPVEPQHFAGGMIKKLCFKGILMAEANTTVEVQKVSKSKLIVAVLKEKGLDLPAVEVQKVVPGASAALINNVKFRMRQVKQEKKAARKRRGVPVPVETTVASPVQGEFDQMIAVKEFAGKVGGLDNLLALIMKVRALAA